MGHAQFAKGGILLEDNLHVVPNCVKPWNALSPHTKPRIMTADEAFVLFVFV